MASLKMTNEDFRPMSLNGNATKIALTSRRTSREIEKDDMILGVL